jgi:hypothetical protein
MTLKTRSLMAIYLLHTAGKVLVLDGLNVAGHRAHERGLLSFRITSRAKQSATAD